VSHGGLAIYIKSILRPKKKKNYGNSNISPCKNNNLPKNALKKIKPKILQDIIITLL
jgi:hypothetical protein